ncbi:MAG: glutamate racemase [Gloeomargarita sp. SKYB31]|nr:glutamate racemase [Gloeomargarita sp. SKYB31]
MTAIGIYDSGLGGLTVLRALQQQLPQEPVVYFGDTARVPYGTRTAAELLTFGREILTWLGRQGVKMVLVACNTSSALVLEQLQREFPWPILGLILPGARAAVARGRRIGVLATPATVASGAYPRAIREACPQAGVWQVPCPALVPLIEQGYSHTPEMRQVLQRYLAPLLSVQVDTVVYGCTHYPLLDDLMAELLPPHVQRIDPAVALVQAAARELDALGLRHHGPTGGVRFGVSGDPVHFQHLAQRWLGTIPIVERVTLPTCLTVGD